MSYLPQNQPPSFIIPASWAVPMDRTASLPFYVYDDVTSPTQLVVTVACADTNLVPAAGLTLQPVDSYGDWSLTLTPSTGQTGTTTLTFSATDDTGFTAITNVTLTVFYSPPVTIPDTNLEAVVRNTLGLPAGPLTAYDLQSLTYLYASYRSISNLTGLEWASNLSTLDLSGNPVVNWTPMLALTQLQTLSLGGCNLHDLTLVLGLTNLTSLTLDGNPTPNLASLASLPNLTSLSASSCSLSNLAGIRALVHLQSLSLGNNSLGNPASLVALTNLTSLDLEDNPLSGTTGLAGLTSLQNLNLSQCSLSSLSGLHTLTKLQYLYLANNSIRDLTPLVGLTNLSYVSLDSNPVTSVAALAGLSRLTGLSVQSCSLSNLVSAQGLTHLHTFYLGNNGIHDLTPLAGLTNLTTLYLSGNSLASIAPLSGLHALGALDLTACSISNATALAWLTQLRSLELGYNYLTDISPLAGLTNLYGLVLTGDRLTNISSLQSLTGLWSADVTRNLLDLSAGSPTMTTITNLQIQGAWVNYEPQNQPPTFYSVRANWIIRPGMAAHTQFALMDDVTLADKVAVTAACSNAGPLSNSVITLVRTSFYIPPVTTPPMRLPVLPLPGPSPSPTPIPIPVQPPLPLGLTRSVITPGIPIGPFGFNAGVSYWDLAVTPPPTQTGTMTITLTATDDTGLSTNATILVTVAAPQPLDGSWLRATNLVWQTGGNAPWFGQTNETCNGSAAAQSGAVEAGDESWLETTVTGPGILTFRWKRTPVSAYNGAYEFQGSATFTTSRGGTLLLPASTTWQEEKVSIPPGKCALDWNYASYAAASPSNACWLAEVSFVAGRPDFWLEVASSPDWPGSGVTLHGEPGGLYELQVSTKLANWLPLESVVFDPVNGGFTSYLSDPAARGARAFYRARQLPATTMWFDLLTFDAIGSPLLRLYSQPGLACEIQASPDLHNWSTLATVTNTTGTFTFTDTQGLPKCFYQARQAP